MRWQHWVTRRLKTKHYRLLFSTVHEKFWCRDVVLVSNVCYFVDFASFFRLFCMRVPSKVLNRAPNNSLRKIALFKTVLCVLISALFGAVLFGLFC